MTVFSYCALRLSSLMTMPTSRHVFPRYSKGNGTRSVSLMISALNYWRFVSPLAAPTN